MKMKKKVRMWRKKKRKKIKSTLSDPLRYGPSTFIPQGDVSFESHMSLDSRRVW
jgi:hypothetical protein